MKMMGKKGSNFREPINIIKEENKKNDCELNDNI